MASAVVGRLRAELAANAADFEGGLRRAAKAAENFGKSVGSVGAESTRAGQAVDRMARGLGGERLIQTANNLTAAVQKIGGVTKLTTAEKERLAGTLDKALAKYRALGQDAPKAMRDLAAATRHAEPPTSVLNTKMVALGAAVGSFVGMMGVQAVRSLGRFAVEAFSSASAILDLANKTGLSAEAIQRMQFVADQTGSSLERFTDTSFQLSRRLGAGGSSVNAALQAVGLSLQELRRLRPEEQFATVMSSLGSVANANDRVRIGAELFGRSFANVAAAAVEGYDKIASAAKVSSQAQIEALDRAGDRWTQFWTNTKANVRSLTGELLLLYDAHNDARLQADALARHMAPLTAELRAGRISLAEYNAEAFRFRRGGAFMGPRLPDATTPEPLRDYVSELGRAQQEVRGLTQEQRRQIVAAQELRVSIEELADRYGVSEVAVRLVRGEIKDLGKDAAAAVKEIDALHASITGEVTIRSAETMMAALGRGVDISKQTAEAQQQIAQTLEAALRVYEASGRVAPLAMGRIVLGIRQADMSLTRFLGTLQQLPSAINLLPDPRLDTMFVAAGMNARSLNAELALTQRWVDGILASNSPVTHIIEHPARIGASTRALHGFFGGMSQGISNMWAQMSGGKGVQGFIKGIGQQIGDTFASIIQGGISSLIGMGVNFVMGKLPELWNAITGGPTRAELEGRQVAAEFHAGLVAGMTQEQRQRALAIPHGTAEWREQIVAIGDAYLLTGRTMDDAMAAGRLLWLSEKYGAEAAGKAIDQINAVMEEAAQIREDANRFVAELPGLLNDVAKSGRLASRELRGLIDRADQFSQTTGAVSDFIRGQVEGAVKGLDAFLQHATVSTQQSANSLTNALIASFSELMRRGMSAREAMELMQPAIANLEAQLERAGLRGSEAWARLRQMAELATGEITGPAIAAVHGLRDAMVGLHNAGLLDQEMFAGLARQAKDTFALVISEGHSHEATLRMIAPTLQTIWELQRDFGYEVDASTGALIEQAAAMGLVGRQHMPAQDRMVEGVERMVELLEQFIKMLEVDLPRAADASARAVGRIETPTAARRIPSAFTAAVQPASFHTGGLITAHKGLFLSGLRSDERLITAETGEGILSRVGMAALGGPGMLDALNKGGGAAMAGAINALGSKAMQPAAGTAPDVESVRMRNLGDRPQGGTITQSVTVNIQGVLDSGSVERVFHEHIIPIIRGNRGGARSQMQVLVGAKA